MNPNGLRWAGVIFFGAMAWMGWNLHTDTNTWLWPVGIASIGVIGMALVLWFARAEQEKNEAIAAQKQRPGPSKIVIKRFR